MFQCLMDIVLPPHHDYTATYLDDVAIHSSTWQDHIFHLGSVLEKLRKLALATTPNPHRRKKCKPLSSTSAPLQKKNTYVPLWGMLDITDELCLISPLSRCPPLIPDQRTKKTEEAFHTSREPASLSSGIQTSTNPSRYRLMHPRLAWGPFDHRTWT